MRSHARAAEAAKAAAADQRSAWRAAVSEKLKREVWVWVCMYMCTYVWVYLWMCLSMYVWMYVSIYECTYVELSLYPIAQRP